MNKIVWLTLSIWLIKGSFQASTNATVPQEPNVQRQEENMENELKPEQQLRSEGCETSSGCLACDQADKCIDCMDESALLNAQGLCECPSYGETFNIFGYCVQCRVLGCATCTQDEYFSSTCAICTDPSATLHEGRCSCPSSQYLNQEGMCVDCPPDSLQAQHCITCSLDNCLSCTNGLDCEVCVDSVWGVIIDGLCQCALPELSFNSEGICVQCMVPGCEVCDSGSYFAETCVVCVDPDASITDGLCSCPDDEVMIDGGWCQGCDVIGCEACMKDDRQACQKCSDSPWAVINDEGLCECSQPTHKINHEGRCQVCEVAGCLHCVAGQPNNCYECSGDNTSFIEGECVCDEGVVQNDEGVCQQCEVLGCVSCKSGRKDFCNRCDILFQLTEDGLCQCMIEGSKINENGLCSNCDVVGCLSCEADDPTICRHCAEGSVYLQSQCVCEDVREKHNQLGLCSQCYIRGCRSCSSGSSSVCLQCEEGLLLNNGNCQCPLSTQKVSPVGVCEDCNVAGCSSCQSGNPDICVRCKDCSAQFILGYCMCPYPMVWSRSAQICKFPIQYAVGVEKQYSLSSTKKIGSTLPTSINWVDEGFVTSVKEEGSSCQGWAYAVTALAESTLLLEGQQNSNIDLSQEYLLLCANVKCQQMSAVQKAIELSLNGLPLQTTQNTKDPYTEENSICSTNEVVEISRQFQKYENLGEEKIIQLLQQGPVLSAVSSQHWQHYVKNIFQCESDAEADHYVLLVGYSDSYWLVKNDWGAAWGEEGYIRVTRSSQHNCLLGSVMYQYVRQSEQGQCSVLACLQCSEGQICNQCHSSALLMDGVCECEEGNVLTTSGICVMCEVSGCEKCAEFSPQTCQQCMPTMKQVEGQCVCENTLEKYSNAQVCQLCYVKGCAVCLTGSPSTCIRCSDCLAMLVEGQCACQVGMVMDGDGVCVRGQCSPPYQSVDGVCMCGQGMFEIGNTCVRCQLDGCDKCANINQTQIYCKQCQQNWFEVDGRCRQCEVENCQKCSFYDTCEQCSKGQLYEGQCISCEVGTYFLVGECQSCSMYHCSECISGEECISCWGETILKDGKCQDCASDEYFQGELCLPCLENCLRCESAGDCQECVEGKVLFEGVCQPCGYGFFYLNQECQHCLDGCLECSSSVSCARCVEGKVFRQGACQYCASGTFYHDGQCHECSAYCLQCSDENSCSLCTGDKILVEGTCQSCKAGFFYTNEQCQSCQQNCLLCADESSCEKCIEGKVLVGGVCQQCPSGSYFSNQQCIECSTSHCFQCSSENCLECQSPYLLTPALECQICAEGYFIIDKICSPCNILGCLQCQSSQKCQTCTDLSFPSYDQTSCVCPSLYVMNSLGICTFVEQNTVDVQSGTFFTQNGQAQCLPGCSSCTSIASCDSCVDSYYLLAQICEKCHKSCLTCSGPSSSDCLTCYPQFFMSGDSCIECQVENCLSCTPENVCLQCQSLYFLQDSICSECTNNCQECADIDTCTRCQFGFGLTEMGECVECLSGCSKCSGSDIRICEVCNLGSYLFGGQCISCPQHCSQCVSATECLYCSSDYQLQGGVCVYECSYPCQECNFVEEQICQVCAPGYMLANNACQPDFSCNEDNICEACPSNYALVDNVCEICTTNDPQCQKCSPKNISKCLACVQGYTLEDGICVSCPSQCKNCLSAQFCLECEEGYFNVLYNGWHTGVCEACLFPCAQCKGQAGRCEKCSEGYYLDGRKCSRNRQILLNLTIQAQMDFFLPVIKQFKAALAEIVDLAYPQSLITLTSLESGSVKVAGNLQAASVDEENIIYQNLETSFTQNKNILGYEILSFQLQRKQFTNDSNPGNQQKPLEEVAEQNGVAIGLAAGAGGLFLVIISVIVYKKCQTKDEQDKKSSIILSQIKPQLSNKQIKPELSSKEMTTQAPISSFFM